MMMQCLVARRVNFKLATRLRHLIPLVALAAISVTAHGADRLQMSAGPVLLGGDTNNGLLVDLENSGPDARGVVRINSSGGTTVYPVELPRGSKKEFVGYPLTSQFNGYNPISCDLETNRGDVHYDLPFTGSNEPKTLEITEDLGGLQFLKNRRTSEPYAAPSAAGTSIYVKPEDAPGRLLAYRDLPAIVLGPGAELISDDAVHALVEYVLGGGRLVFVGGAVAPAMHDPRWKSILPIENPHAVTKEVSLHIGSFGFRQMLSVQEGERIPGSHTSEGGVITDAYGLGQVIVLPFDILDGPLKTWDGRESFFSTLSQIPTARSIVWADIGPNNDGRGYAGYSSSPYGGYVPPGVSRPEDPFSFQPPRPESVALIIILYLILVAPVNFFVLRRIKKAEWAWFSTPIISIVFAAFILKLAAGLYFGKMMTAVHGTLLVAENSPVGIFRGSSQLFFPSGGSYDLQLSNVDWLSTSQSYSYRPRGSSSDQIDVLDVGQMVVPDMKARNLQFKDLDFEQLVDTAGWFTFAVKRVTNNVEVTVTNHSDHPFSGGSLSAEGASAPLLDLQPGKAVSLSLSVSPKFRGQDGSLAAYSRSIHRVILTGTLSGFRPGPQIGNEVAERNRVQVTAIGDTSTAPGGSN